VSYIQACFTGRLLIDDKVITDRHLDALDLARAHAVLLCSRPPALAFASFLLLLAPAEETPREMKTADGENFLEDKQQQTLMTTFYKQTANGL